MLQLRARESLRVGHTLNLAYVINDRGGDVAHPASGHLDDDVVVSEQQRRVLYHVKLSDALEHLELTSRLDVDQYVSDCHCSVVNGE